jgi:putative endonuclease
VGEDFALAHLEHLGFTPLARNYRSRRGELDLIVVDRKTLVFVEVKTRLQRMPGARMPATSLDWLGSRQLALRRPLAAAWLRDKTHPAPPLRDIRFDAIGVLLDADAGLVALEHVQEVA